MPGMFGRQALAGKAIDLARAAMTSLVNSHFVQHQLDSVGFGRVNQYDDLTGLMTRATFVNCLREYPRTEPASTALLYIDLDRFKPVNDEFEHEAGDRILVELARRLEGVMDCVGRQGGDEFVGIVSFEAGEGIYYEVDLFEILATILDEIKRPFYGINPRDPQEPVTIGASIGARILGLEVDPDTEISNADTAMYTAKREGAPWRVYSNEVYLESRRHNTDTRMHLLERLEEMKLNYQLIYNLRNGEAEIAEAAMHLPGENVEYFMSGVERRSSVNRPLFLAMLEKACRTAMTWPRNPSGKDIILSFNLPIELLDRDLRERIFKLLDETGLKPHRLQFEILERGRLAGNDEARRIIGQLRRHGIAFYLDDIGEKNANIEIIDEYEQHLKGLKIGTAFTIDMIHDLKKRGLVETLLFLATKLDKEAIVEGIESALALDIIAPYDPPFVQGFLMHRPELDGPALHDAMQLVSQHCIEAGQRYRELRMKQPSPLILIEPTGHFIDLEA